MRKRDHCSEDTKISKYPKTISEIQYGSRADDLDYKTPSLRWWLAVGINGRKRWQWLYAGRWTPKGHPLPFVCIRALSEWTGALSIEHVRICMELNENTRSRQRNGDRAPDWRRQSRSPNCTKERGKRLGWERYIGPWRPQTQHDEVC